MHAYTDGTPVLFFLVFPLLGLRVSPFTLWVPTLHTEGLQQSEVSSVQPASLRLRWVYVSAISVCFRTPRLSLGHPGSLTSVHDLKCMRTQTAPLFNVPRGRRGTTTRVVHPYPCGTSRAGNRTRVVAWGVQSANRYTMGPSGFCRIQFESLICVTSARMLRYARVQCNTAMLCLESLAKTHNTCSIYLPLFSHRNCL